MVIVGFNVPAPRAGAGDEPIRFPDLRRIEQVHRDGIVVQRKCAVHPQEVVERMQSILVHRRVGEATQIELDRRARVQR